MKTFKNQQGQALLIAVMLMAVILTVVFSASFVSRTDTQLSKLEEDSQRALAAAEAGIEAALQTGATVNIAGLAGLGPQGAAFTGTATVDAITAPTFVAPLIPQGKQYTLYLATPSSTSNPDFTQPLNTATPIQGQPIRICSSSTTVAIVATLIKSGNSSLRRFVINPPGSAIITSSTPGNLLTGTAGGSGCPSGQDWSAGYTYQLSGTDVGIGNLFLIARFVGSGSGARMGFVGGPTNTPVNFPVQGRTIVSTAVSQTNVTKKIQLFQSYPQIPAEFFVTSF